MLFQGQSECVRCKQVLGDGREFTGFPPLINNMNDALYIFSDARAHVDCINKHPLKD